MSDASSAQSLNTTADQRLAIFSRPSVKPFLPIGKLIKFTTDCVNILTELTYLLNQIVLVLDSLCVAGFDWIWSDGHQWMKSSTELVEGTITSSIDLNFADHEDILLHQLRQRSRKR